MFGDNLEFVSQVKIELFFDRIYVYITKGDIIELQKGATPIDFAIKYILLVEILWEVFVNDEYFLVDYQLENKDKIMVMIDDLAFDSREDWINKV